MDAQDMREQAFRDLHTSGRAPFGNLVTAGVIAAFLLPLAGIIIGIVLLFKERVGAGLGCVLLSVLMAGVYVYALVLT